MVKPVGDIDLETAPSLRQALLEGVADGRRRVLLDLADVTFIDSSGLAVLVTAYKRLLASDGELRLAGATEAVRASMRISGLDRVITIYPDAAAAAPVLRSVPAPRPDAP